MAIPSAAAFAALVLFAVLPGWMMQNRPGAAPRPARLVTAVLLSLPATTLIFALTRMLALPPEACALTMGFLPAVGAFIPRSAPTARERCRGGNRIALVLGVVAAALLFIAMRSPGILASWHGFFHAAVTEQILHEGIPPTNPGLVGETLNFYWAFHVFVALIAAASRAHPLIVIAAINAMMLALSLWIAFDASRRLIPRVRHRLLAMAALLGVVNTGAGAVLLAKLVRHGAIPADSFSDGTWIDWLSQRAIPGRLWDGRASSFIKEFYDISGMAAGLTLVFACVWLTAAPPRNGKAGRSPLLALTLFTLATWYPPLALPALAYAALTLICHLDGKPFRAAPAGKRWTLASPRRFVAHAFLVATAVFLVWFYFHTITDASGWIERGEPFIAFRLTARSLVSAVAPFWAALLFILIGAALAFRRARSARFARRLLTWILILFVFAAAADLQQNTQYKYIYALALPLGLLTATGTAWLLERVPPLRRFPRLSTAVLTILFMHSAFLFAFGAATSRQQHDSSLRIIGRNLVDQTDPARMDALAWIRDHAPPDAVLLLPLIAHDRSPSNPGFREPAIAQRPAFLVHDTFHSLRFRAHAPRADILRGLFDGVQSDAATAALDARNFSRPLYVIIPAGSTPHPSPRWAKVYANETWSVWQMADRSPQ